MTEFADHFSGVSTDYATFRPSYPDALFDALCDAAPSQAIAWDCGCGTGQASVALAHRFTRVVATDASESQIAKAAPHPRVAYHVADESASGLADASVGLVTVAQALHWFDVDRFHQEAARVLVKGGIIAEWSYGLLEVQGAPDVTALIAAFDAEVGPYWPPERAHVDNGYRDLDFPFTPLNIGEYVMEALWTRQQLLGYLGTWSAVSRQRAETGLDALEKFAEALLPAWGDCPVHRMRWPLALRAGRHGGAPRGAAAAG